MMTACKNSGSYHDNKTYPYAIYGEITEKAFNYEGPLRNPVIVIHGLFGARLEDTANHENIWGDFGLSNMMLGEKSRKLAHPMARGIPLRNLTNTTAPSGVLEKSSIRLMGLEFEQDNYDILVNNLAQCGYVPDNKPLPTEKSFYSQFLFYYDWRRDISENAVALEKFIQEKRRYLQEHYERLYGLKDYDVQFDLVAHSMGGLLARYFMRYGGRILPENENEELPLTWDGGKYVDKVILIATPNGGYVDTLIEMTEGLRLVSASPAYPKTVIGTFISYYQMLPDKGGKHIVWTDSGEEVDYFSPKTWVKYRWGLADPAQDKYLRHLLPNTKSAEERYQIALDHLDKALRRARQFKQAMQRHAEDYPDDISVYLIAGDAVMTNHTLSVDPETGKLTVIRGDSGDGKITASSARLDLRDGGDWLFFMTSPINWAGVYYFQGSHMGIMNSEVFASNLRYLLLNAPTQHQRRNKDAYLKILKQVQEFQNAAKHSD